MIVDQLAKLVPEFMGDASHMWCLLHVVNLVTKTLLLQFEVKHKTINNVDDDKDSEDGEDDEADGKFKDLIRELDDGDDDDDNDEMSKDEANNTEGWVDETDESTKAEWLAAERSAHPVRLVLFKAIALPNE